MLKNHVFGSLNLNNSEIFRLSFEDIFLGTLDTYTKKMNPPSAVLRGGGVHGKVCWLLAYMCTYRSWYVGRGNPLALCTLNCVTAWKISIKMLLGIVKVYNTEFNLNKNIYFKLFYQVAFRATIPSLHNILILFDIAQPNIFNLLSDESR